MADHEGDADATAISGRTAGRPERTRVDSSSFTMFFRVVRLSQQSASDGPVRGPSRRAPGATVGSPVRLRGGAHCALRDQASARAKRAEGGSPSAVLDAAVARWGSIRPGGRLRGRPPLSHREMRSTR